MTRSDDYLWDRSGDVDPDVARLEALLSPLRHQPPVEGGDELASRRRRRAPIVLGVGLAIAAMLALVVWWRWPAGGAPPQLACAGTTGFSFTSTTGSVACNGVNVSSGVLPVDGTLDTGAHRAELAIADIGTAALGSDTRVRLDHTSGTRHQLFLEHGRMHARVDAPPRLFAVATPSARVVDLGCEYTLEIGRDGAGSIHVTSGKVELETASGNLVVVPEGAHARLLPGRRASVPVSDLAGPDLIAAVREHDAGSADGIVRVLAAATIVDAITVANLAQVVPPARRRIVLERLAELVPAPQHLTIDEALEDAVMFEMWFDEVVLVHTGAASIPAKAPASIDRP